MMQNTPSPAKKRNRFYPLLLLITLLFLVGVFAGNYILKRHIRTYEANHPQTAARKAFTRLYQQQDYTELMHFDALAKQNAGGQRAVPADYLKNYLSGKTLSYAPDSSDAQSCTYTVSADGTPFSSFTLSFSHKASGGQYWVLTDAHLMLQGNQEVTVRVPHGMTPIVNGEVLTEQYRTGEQALQTPIREYLPDSLDTSQLYFDLYTYGSLYCTPQVLLQGADDTQYEAIPDADDPSCYYYDVFPCSCTKEEADVMTSAALQAQKAVEDYFSSDKTYEEIADKVLNNPKAPAKQEIMARQTNGNAVPAHDSVTYPEEDGAQQVTHLYRYDQYTYSCRVKLTRVLTDSQTGEKSVLQSDCVLVMVDPGDGIYRIYSRIFL